ncbi:hypothetical protein TWF696_001278 [Orbilia brochopaga]|uniref:Uncharacterized protein n=1 Tax=Orbilia brochopaga TaxID=3140254 RepID=A0AAV9U8Z6_9PEZI
MARQNKMRMEWTLASCRTPRSSRKDIEDIFHKSSPASNRVSKPKAKKTPKKNKKIVTKGSWDPTGDDSSQIAEDEGIKHDKIKHNKKTGSAGPIKHVQAFPRKKISGTRIRDEISDDTPTKKRGGAPVYAFGSDSEYSSLTTDIDIDDEETALNDYSHLISDSEDSDIDDDDSAEDIDDEDMEDLDDDQSILDEETDFITGVPLTSDDNLVNVKIGVPNSPSAFSAESDDDNEDIYMDMDDPVVQKIMNHSYTICDDGNENSDDMLEPYFSDEAFADSEEYDSDATAYDIMSIPSRSPSPTPVPESANEKTPTKPPRQPFMQPQTGWFTPSPGRNICIIKTVPGGFKTVTNISSEEFFMRGDSSTCSSSTTVTSPVTKASEELFAFRTPTQYTQYSQYSASIPSEDWDSMSSANREVLFGSEWDESFFGDFSTTTRAHQEWTEYLVEGFEPTPDDLETDPLNMVSVVDEEIVPESSPIRSFSVPVTAFRVNQNNALSRNNSIASSIHQSGIKKNAPRKDSSLTPSQRRKSDATHPGRKKTPTPPALYPAPLEPLFDDAPLSDSHAHL